MYVESISLETFTYHGAGVPGMKFEPLEGERRFMSSLNLALMQRTLWPLLVTFILLSFSDVLTTVAAAVLTDGFMELNPLGAHLFSLGLVGFMLAYLLKFVVIIPLFYMVALRRSEPRYDFQVRLLKFTALVVLAAADIGFGAIVLGNNLPVLFSHLSLGGP